MKKVLITGGAGFIGFNASNHFLKKNWSVSIIDNFSRNTSNINKPLLLKILMFIMMTFEMM